MAADAWQIEPFDPKRHDRSNFDCGAPILNDWLATKISQYQRRDLARAYVLLDGAELAVKGYYALSSHTVIYEALPADQAKGLPRIDIPVILIGRLAVDVSVRGQGLGEFLLLDALRRAEFLATKIEIRAVEVEALDPSARQFYLKYGFIPLEDDPAHLFLPLKVLRKLNLPPLG